MAARHRRKIRGVRRRPDQPNKAGTRGVILAACVGYFVQLGLKSRLLPHGTAQQVPHADRTGFAPIDPSSDILRAKHGKLTKIFERVPEGAEPLMKGPETVVFSKDGTMHVLTEEALLVSLSDFQTESKQKGEATIQTAKATVVADLGMGRPLGGRFTPDGKTIYIADAVLGLISVHEPHKYPDSKVELVASKVMDNGTMTKILYANDVAIGPKTGKVYFTDSSDIIPDRAEGRTWDTMYASKLDLMRGSATGRLLEYDPKKDQTKVLARNLRFCNGVGVDKDESYVFMAETFSLRLLKYYLKGPSEGTMEIILDSHNMTGYPDGADCAWTGKKKCYAAMPSSVVPIAKLMNKIPHPIDMILRNLVMALPKAAAPKVKPYGGVVEIDPVSKEMRLIQDPDATDIGMLTGVTVWKDKLYLGSLRNDFIGVYNLK